MTYTCFQVAYIDGTSTKVHADRFETAVDAMKLAKTLHGGSVIPGTVSGGGIHYLDARRMEAEIKAARTAA